MELQKTLLINNYNSDGTFATFEGAYNDTQSAVSPNSTVWNHLTVSETSSPGNAMGLGYSSTSRSYGTKSISLKAHERSSPSHDLEMTSQTSGHPSSGSNYFAMALHSESAFRPTTTVSPMTVFNSMDQNCETTNLNTIPIVSPVPIPYSARNKAAVRAMISAASRSIDSHIQNPIYALTVDAYVFTDDLSPKNFTTTEECSQVSSAKNVKDIQLTRSYGRSGVTVNPSSVQPLLLPTRSKFFCDLKRPISPSTLIALTEPCLMAWCNSPSLQVHVPPVTQSRKSSAEEIFIGHLSNAFPSFENPITHNSWGY